LKGEFMGPSAVDPLLAKLPFSPQARSIFESAGDLATQFGHREIVPQHILFAFLAKPESTRLEILGELPIDYDSLQKLLQTALLRNDRPSDSQDPSSRTALDVGFNRYTEKAIKVILRAQEESRRLGHNYVGTEQILLGLISEGTGIAAKTLKTKKISLKETRNAVEKIIGRGNGFVSVQIPFTTRAKDLFEGAWMEARAFGHDYVGTEHLLLSLVHLQESVGLRVLQGFGISPAEIQECVRTMLLITQEQHYIQESPLAGAYQPTDDAAALRRKIARWESEADLCRRVEKEAIRQAEICRRALSEMTSEDSNDSISDES
jgi:ATP-dependent Clp protease ATP-binding subunit ClpA